MRLLSLLTFIILLASQTREGSAILLPNEDARIYSVILDSVASAHAYSKIVVLDSTIRSYTLCSLQDAFTKFPLRVPKDSNTALFNRMLADFDLLNSKRVAIDPKTILSNVSIETVSRADAYKQRPSTEDKFGLCAFSRVLFSPDSTSGVVFFETYHSALDGNGAFVLLRRSQNRWRVISSALMWIS
jgi:hypothetical protein